MRWALVADADDPMTEMALAEADALAAGPVPTGRFHTMMILEDAWSGDYRFINQDALTWRELPLPFSARDTTDEMHNGAVQVGLIDTMERQGSEIHGWGSYVADPSEEQAHLIGMIQRGELRWVSADLDEMVAELLLDMGPDTGEPVAEEPVAPIEGEALLMDEFADAPPEETEVIDGNEYLVLPLPTDRFRVTSARLMGATALPYQAFQEAYVEPDDSAPITEEAPVATLVAAVSVPVEPPSAWFTDPLLDGVTPFTITDEGEVIGHLAAWNSCHIGMPGCTPPPRSGTSYAHFLVGQVRTAEGERVATGPIALRGGHADIRSTAAEARAHYDDTRSAFCDVTVGEDAHGIWVHGALRPGLTATAVRTAMASDVSGDWRMIGRGLELVGVCSVNVPGFHKPRMETYTVRGLVASMQVSHPLQAYAREERLQRAAADRIAATIGRSFAQRREALHSRVHAGVS